MSSARPLLPLELAGSFETRRSALSISHRRSGSPFAAEFMTFAEFARQIDAAEGIVELDLQGCGEPMLHPRFFDMVQYATLAGMRVSTYSNGTALLRASAERCVTSGLDSLRLVLGVVTAVGRTPRGRARREYVLGSLDAVVAARERLGSRHPQLEIVVALMRRNVDELPALVERAARHGAELLYAEPLGVPAAQSHFPPVYLPTPDCVVRESLLRENPARVAQSFEAASRAAARLGVALELPRLPEPRLLPRLTPPASAR